MKDEHGATILEFAIAISIFLMFLGLIVDVGLTMQRKTMLTNVAKEVSRLIAIRLANSTNLDCDIISDTIVGDGGDISVNKYNVRVSSWLVQWHTPSNLQAHPSLNISLTSTAPCFFICNFYPNGMTASTTVQTTVSKIEYNTKAPPGCAEVRI